MLVKFFYLKNRKEKHEGVKRHRAEAKEAIDLQDYLSTMKKLTPEQLNTEIKIFKEHLWFFCNKKFGVQMPLLEQTTNLVTKEGEEACVHYLVETILQSQNKAFTIENLWVLKKDLEKKDKRDAISMVLCSFLTLGVPP
jgi:hypothetical protein